MKALDLTNQKFGDLLVLYKEQGLWKCLCVCGNTFYDTANHVKNVRTSCGCKKIKPLGEASFNDLYERYKYRATKIGKEFLLTKEEFKIITKQNCYYCGIEPKQEASKGRSFNKKYNGTYIFNGIDRVDNLKGYSLDNCVPCCLICNQAKSDLEIEDFNKWLRHLVIFQNQKI